MNRNVLCLLLGIAALFAAVGAAHADSILVPNGSFETPVFTAPPYLDLSANPNGMAPWVCWQGYILNLPIYSGNTAADGNQAVYVWTGDPDPGNRPYFFQSLETNFEAGQDYTLTLAASMWAPPGGSAGVATPGQTLEMSLGYWEEGQTGATGPTLVAQRLIAYDEINATWQDYSVSTGAISGDDPAVGQPIVIFVSQGNAPYVTGPQYQFDNVRCDVVVPEPGTVALLVSGLVGLIAYAWRKRK
jgi:hypothetical protein